MWVWLPPPPPPILGARCVLLHIFDLDQLNKRANLVTGQFHVILDYATLLQSGCFGLVLAPSLLPFRLHFGYETRSLNVSNHLPPAFVNSKAQCYSVFAPVVRKWHVWLNDLSLEVHIHVRSFVAAQDCDTATSMVYRYTWHTPGIFACGVNVRISDF